MKIGEKNSDVIDTYYLTDTYYFHQHKTFTVICIILIFVQHKFFTSNKNKKYNREYFYGCFILDRIIIDGIKGTSHTILKRIVRIQTVGNESWDVETYNVNVTICRIFKISWVKHFWCSDFIINETHLFIKLRFLDTAEKQKILPEKKTLFYYGKKESWTIISWTDKRYFVRVLPTANNTGAWKQTFPISWNILFWHLVQILVSHPFSFPPQLVSDQSLKLSIFFFQGESNSTAALTMNLPSTDSPPYLSFFQTLHFWYFWRYNHNEIRDKHKKKLMTESYFFIFKRLQNNIKCFFKETFISNARLRFDSK